MTRKVAFLFPGQGAQYPGMGKDFALAFTAARLTFEEADDLLSLPLSKVIFEGPENLLTETRYSQLAIFVNSVAILRTVHTQLPDLLPAVCAGLSLGEYTALFASGSLDFARTLGLVRLRGEFMHQACLSTSGAMSAILGLSANEVEEKVKSLHPPHDVWVANFNCPGQTVVSGTKEGVEAAEAALKAIGAKRAIPLQVAGAFHSGLMRQAEEALAPWVNQAPLQEGKAALVMNVPGDVVTDIEEIKRNLIRQVTSSVRWEQSIQAIEKKGDIALYLEIGCGKTLSGLNRKIGVKVPTLSLDKVADLDGLAKQLEGVCIS
jgi:[acyl-carrier-protein] S-malonyltransferase